EHIGADHGVEYQINIVGNEAENHHPHRNAGQFGIPFAAYFLRPKRVHNGQKTVDADGHRDLAELTSKHPVAFNKVRNPKRQVHHVCRGLIPRGNRGDRYSAPARP
uniref:Uncharacterized protein n=1 Tax=Amphiprion ocellaris TaxID=80972 RepID=A0AAQ5WZR6_AMPOC